jgi:hypothetical protein
MWIVSVVTDHSDASVSRQSSRPVAASSVMTTCGWGQRSSSGLL